MKIALEELCAAKDGSDLAQDVVEGVLGDAKNGSVKVLVVKVLILSIVKARAKPLRCCTTRAKPNLRPHPHTPRGAVAERGHVGPGRRVGAPRKEGHAELYHRRRYASSLHGEKTNALSQGAKKVCCGARATPHTCP